jgi:hypothetical protein
VNDASAKKLTQFTLRTFASVLFLTIVALVMFREQHGSWTAGFSLYWSEARYVVPAAVALAPFLIESLLALGSLPLLLGGALRVGLAIGAIAGNLEYAAHIRPKIAPTTTISHARAWRSILSMARECCTAKLPVPNVSLKNLTSFEGSRLADFESLLRADLNPPPDTTISFLPPSGSATGFPAEYRQRVPSLERVLGQLGD